MDVDLAVLADAANMTENGKLNILGAFDNFNLGPSFPAQSPTFAIVARIVAHPSEFGGHDLVIRLADADGKELAKLEAHFEVARKRASAKPARIPVILQAQVKFQEPGEYVFDVLIDGRWEKTIPLEVRRRP